MTDPNGWPDEVREVLAAALYTSSTEGAGNVMPWAEFCAYHGQEYEGVARFYRRAAAVLAVLAFFLAARDAAAYQRGAEAMREACEDVAEHGAWCPCGGPPCQTPPGHGCGASDMSAEQIRSAIRALPIPEDKP